MILEEETYKKFGYYPSGLSRRSDKRILAACNECGKIRKTSKHAYRDMCPSCVIKGDRNPNYGKHCSIETKNKISTANKGKLEGYKHPN